MRLRVLSGADGAVLALEAADDRPGAERSRFVPRPGQSCHEVTCDAAWPGAGPGRLRLVVEDGAARLAR